jgi:REP element-mobilizing transposase RayT
MKVLEVGGVADHVHLLLSIPASLAVSKAVQLVKGG